jgi:Bacterial PH domain
MRVGDDIYNLDGLPFRNEGKALRMCDLLSGETGNDYRLEPYPEGGFVVRLAASEQSYRKPGRQQPSLQPLPIENPVSPELGLAVTANTVPVTTPKDYELRQAVFRTNLCALFLMAVAVCVVLLPDSLLLAVLEVIKIQPRQLGAWLQRLDQGMTGVGSAMLIVIWLSFLWQRAGALYRVTGFGVEARLGIIAHQTVGLRFQDIRSMGIKQSLLDRLLNVGLLEFTSAGTDEDPVRFNRVANPGKVLRIVKARMAGPGGSD